MIVKCEQCQTRFKIPDDKVTDKGVKVRCTKCSHTFRVTRESAAAGPGTLPPVPTLPAPGSPEAGFDPFERFGTAPEPPKGQITRPGQYAEGIAATRTAPPPPSVPLPPAPWNSADSGVEEDVFQETTRVMPLQVPTEARPPVPSLPPLPFDFAPPAAAPATAPRGATPAPGQGLPGPRGASFRPSAEPAAPIPSVPSVAPSVPARSLPTPPPVKPGAAAQARPLAGGAPAASRPVAPPSAPAAPGAARPGGRPAALAPAPAPAAAPPAADLFTEFFASPPAGAAPVPLPDLPPPGMPDLPPVAAPAPVPARSPVPTPSFGAGDGDPFGSVSGDLGEPPPDLGPAPEFDPTAMFSEPAPAPAPLPPPPAPPAPAAMGRPTPLPVASGAPPMGMGRPPTGAPVGRLAPSAAIAHTPAPVHRLAPSPMLPPTSAPAPMPAAPVSSAVDADPFGPSNADLGEPPGEFGFSPDAPPEPMFAAPAPAPIPAPVPAPASVSPMPFADEDPFGPAGMAQGGAPPDGQAAPAPDFFAAPAPAAPPPSEFDAPFGGAMPPAQAAPGVPDPGFAPPGPMDFGMIGDEQFPAEPAPTGAPAAGMADPFAAPAPAAGFSDPFAAPAPAAGFSDPFAAQASAAGMADPFAAAEPAFAPTETGRHKLGSGDASQGFLTQTDTSHQVISPTDTGRSMLDFPAHSGAHQAPGEEAAPVSRELIDLPAQPSEMPEGGGMAAPTLAAPAIARPAGRPADMGIPERRRPSTAQQVTGQVAYLTIAAGLLLAVTALGAVYMKEGRVDPAALSPAYFMKLLTPSEFVTRDITNGLYDTRGGTPLFYVRGEVENRASKPVRVKVSAALYDGAQRVKSAEGLAGLVPNPEDLHAVTSPEASAQLRSRLDAGATVIPPGGRAPFTVVFQEYPQELNAFRLKVTAEAAPEEGRQP